MYPKKLFPFILTVITRKEKLMKNIMNIIPNREGPNGNFATYREGANAQFITLEEISSNRLKYQPMYHEQGIEGAISSCYMRKEVGERLLKATELLPKQYSFLIYDAWRPYDVQYALYKEYYEQYKRQHPEKKEEVILKEIKAFVSVPSKDINTPFVHGTGGAVDLTIIDRDGTELQMGTPFDAFCEQSNTAYYEGKSEDVIARDNRRLLYSIMMQAGFTNLPSEWWHYDYGNHFWAYYTRNNALYKGVLSESEVKRL